MVSFIAFLGSSDMVHKERSIAITMAAEMNHRYIQELVITEVWIKIYQNNMLNDSWKDSVIIKLFYS